MVTVELDNRSSTPNKASRKINMSSKRKEVKAVVDSKQEVFHPLDYSFKGVSQFEDLIHEKPRLRNQQLKGVVNLEDELSAGSSGSMQFDRSPSTSLKLNNNLLSSWGGFMLTVSRLFEDPSWRLGWIDFSFNDLKTIDDSLLELPNLTTIYLHGNNIVALSQIDKLSCLEKLQSLTLHGNPIEINSGYRLYALSRIPQLKTFDFSGISKADRATCHTWRTMIAPKPKPPKLKQHSDVND